MVRVGTDAKGYLVCPCGRTTLRYWTTESYTVKKFFLESHLAPGVTDPQDFCKHSHAEIDNGDQTPLLVYESSMGRSRALIKQLGLGREDEEMTPMSEYQSSRLPLGVLGRRMGTRC